MAELRIAKDLALPLDAATEKLAWLGRTGSGKTYGCKRFVEQLLRASAQVLIIDTVGVWPGLRLGPKAFDIPVIGGLYGDIPLDSSSGELVADLVVSRHTSMILDVSLMSDAERSRFMAAFGARFFMAKKKSKSAVHVVLEECQEVVPQNPQKGEERMLHEWVRIAKLGRNFGIGISFISQRPQEVSKKALNQAECVFAFQLTGPHERKALAYWLSDRGSDDVESLDDILPTLERGAPHVWSPSWLKISKVVKILPIDTLDTSETPKVGDSAFEAKKLTPIDIEALRAEMAALEQPDEDDDDAPKRTNGTHQQLAEMRGRIAELERELDAARARVDAAARRLYELGGLAGDAAREMLPELVPASAQTIPISQEGQREGEPPIGRLTLPVVHKPSKSNGHMTPASSPSGLARCAREILTALVQHGDLSLVQAAIIAGYASDSGGVRNAAGELRAGSFVEGSNAMLSATPKGRAEVAHAPKLPTGRKLAEYWYTKLDRAERLILSEVLGVYPQKISLTDAAKRAGYAPDSGGVRNAAGKLRTLNLVRGGNAGMTGDKRLV